MLRIDRNCRIGGLNFKAAAINQIGWVQRCSITKLGKNASRLLAVAIVIAYSTASQM